MSAAKKLLAALCASQDMAEYVRADLRDELFEGEDKTLYQLVNKSVMNHGKLPNPATLADFGFYLPEVHEPPSFYQDIVERLWAKRVLKNAAIQLHETLNTKEDDPKAEEKAKALLDETYRRIHVSQNRRNVVDMREARKIIKEKALLKKAQGADYGIKTGWKAFDDMSGGLEPGDVVSIVGRPASGKTFLLLWIAFNIWMKQGKIPLLVSMEMNPTLIIQRMVAIISQLNMTHVKHMELTTKQYQKFKEALIQMEDMSQAFPVVGGNLAESVDSIITYCHQWKADCCLIDGAYLLKSENPRAGQREKITDTAEAIKGRLAERLGIPVIASYQFNREAAKKTKKEGNDAIGIEDIYGADVVGQISSIVLGLMQPEQVNTIAERNVKILKGRSGEQGEFNIHWNFVNTDFSEVVPEALEDINWLV